MARLDMMVAGQCAFTRFDCGQFIVASPANESAAGGRSSAAVGVS